MNLFIYYNYLALPGKKKRVRQPSIDQDGTSLPELSYRHRGLLLIHNNFTIFPNRFI